MLLFKPDYYDCFRCAAGECPDSCCKEWEVEIDDASARFYRTLPGTLGDRLRQVMRNAGGKTSGFRRNWEKAPCAKPAGCSPA